MTEKKFRKIIDNQWIVKFHEGSREIRIIHICSGDISEQRDTRITKLPGMWPIHDYGENGGLKCKACKKDVPSHVAVYLS